MKKMKVARKILKKRSVRKILVSRRGWRFVVPISIQIPISHRETVFRKKEFSIVKAGLILMLIIGINLFGFLSIGDVVAFYNDIESSTGNIFAAGSLDFTVDIEKQDNRFQTHTQGGWGSRAHGNNPGAYRDANFASAFPGGALIGLPNANYSATFTDADAVEDFLPAGGTPAPFTGNHTDPVSTEAGVLAGQVLALTLNVVFDLYDPDFAPSVNNLSDYVINDSSVPCDGMTVQEVLNEANTILGGLPGSFSASDINECATWVNEEFDGGGGDGIFPGTSISKFATVLNDGSLDFQYMVHMEQNSNDNDDDFCNALNLEAVLEGVTHYTGNLMTFVSSPVVYSFSADEWEFIISLNTVVEGSCSFDFVFKGWQTNLESFGGFSDIERIKDPIHSAVSVTVNSEENVEVEEQVQPEDSGLDSDLLTGVVSEIVGAVQDFLEAGQDETATTTEAVVPDTTATTTEQTLPGETTIITEEQPAIEEQPVVVEELITIEQPVPPPADSTPSTDSGQVGSPQAE